MTTAMKTDDLDDARINRLIARYSHICDASEELQVGHFRTHENDATNTSPVFGQSTSPTQAYTVMDNNVYKIHSNEGSGKENDYDNYMRLNYDCPYYDSFHSRSFHAESSTSKTGHKCYKVDSDKSKIKVTFQDQNKNVGQQTSYTGEKLLSRQKSYAEKTTYCRPVNKIYDDHFVHSVMEKNTKLQLLLTKCVIAQQKEKEKENWSAYVQNLTEKSQPNIDHSTHLSPPRKLLQEMDRNVYNTKNKLTDSCQEIWQDLYTPKTELYLKTPPESEEGEPFNDNTIRITYDDELHFFPTKSRVIKKDLKNHDCSDDIKPEVKQNKDVQTYITFGGYSDLGAYSRNELEPTLRVKLSEIHVAIRNKSEIEEKIKRKETHDKATGNIYMLKEINQSCKLTQLPKTKKKDLENQLAILTNIFNSFILECKPKESLSEKNSNDRVVDTSSCYESSDSAQNKTRKASKKKKKLTIVCNVMTNTSLCGIESQSTTSIHSLNSRPKEIMYDELDKSNKLKNEIETMSNHTTSRQCAVQISIDIPTKDRSTEVTDSLSKTKLSESGSKTYTTEDVNSPTSCHTAQASQKCAEERQCVKSQRRVAVNTETMCLQGLLKFSMEAFKQILPNTNCWYLPGEHLPASQSANYVCNVCGVLFARQSQLCAHILEHNFGQGRDCCVSRHALEPQPEPGFRCEHCGQRFQRSYCCELHQRTCARKLSRHQSPADVMLR